MAATADAQTVTFEEAWATFFRATRRARGRANQHTPEGELSLSQFQLLEPLLDTPQASGRLAEQAGITAPTASRMIESLAARGFLERTADPDDRRVVRLSFTAAGRAAAERKRDEIVAGRQKLAAALDPEQREQATALLMRLAEVVEEL